MTTNPPYKVSYDFGQTWIPLPQTLWKNFGSAAELNSNVMPAVQAAGVTATLSDWTAYLGIALIKTDPSSDVAAWVINGKDTGGNQIQDWAGWLEDRRTNPNPFVDPNYNPSSPGHLVVNVYTPGAAELRWSN